MESPRERRVAASPAEQRLLSPSSDRTAFDRTHSDATNSAVLAGLRLLEASRNLVEKHPKAIEASAAVAATVGAFAFRGTISTALERIFPEVTNIIPELFEAKPAARELVSRLNQNASSIDWSKRFLAASEMDAPPELLTKLSTDANENIRIVVARHPMTPIRTLQQMMYGGTEEVKDSVRTTLHTRDADRLKIAQSAGVHPSTLHRLAVEDGLKIKEAVGLNWETAPSTLRMLAFDRDPAIRTTVAMHEATPPGMLSALAATQIILFALQQQPIRISPQEPFAGSLGISWLDRDLK